jgi:WD40 repeat protein
LNWKPTPTQHTVLLSLSSARDTFTVRYIYMLLLLERRWLLRAPNIRFVGALKSHSSSSFRFVLSLKKLLHASQTQDGTHMTSSQQSNLRLLATLRADDTPASGRFDSVDGIAPDPVLCVRFTRDSAYLLSTTKEKRLIHLWNPQSGTHVAVRIRPTQPRAQHVTAPQRSWLASRCCCPTRISV